jgi:phosphoglycerol transferase MdoB-like AlkP superfamily enzyme
LCRLVFFVANHSSFPGVSLGQFLADCFFGLRFDTFSIGVSNSLFILLSALPLRALQRNGYQVLLKIIYILSNTVFIAINCVDIAYYPFIKKRSTADLLEQMGGQSELFLLLPQFLRDFWWAFLFFAALVCLLLFLYGRVRWQLERPVTKTSAGARVLHWFIFLLVSSLTVLGVRGGLQRVPIDVVNAGSMTRPAEVPIVLNTPFTIIKSVSQKKLEEYSFIPAETISRIYNPVHQYPHVGLKKQNVVVLILESFSKEYTRLGKTKSVTPFLDSLMDHSLLFTNGFSNGTKSIEGIPAVLSSLPSLMADPFINSMYANNYQTSLAYLLGKEGYQTAFFHGGINGTMNFDDWAATAGYQQYFGKDEYGDERDFDQFWGIWDEPFLQYSVTKMDEFTQPFHTAIFTLSSHHPYFIPEKYKGKFPKTALENSESIGYADYSLRKFFDSAAKAPWYKNTLFVLVADHCGISEHPFYSRVVGNLSIPILFYTPGDGLKGTVIRAFSQVDILPSVLDLLEYNKPFFAFGESFREKNYGNDYYFSGSTHYLPGDSTVYCFNVPDIRVAFNYRRDSTLANNIAGKYPALDSLNLMRFRAFIQTYNHTLIHNSGRLSD